MQESKLVQLKSRVSDLLKGKVPSDPVFLRFLRARDFNVDKVSKIFFSHMLTINSFSFDVTIKQNNGIHFQHILGKRNAIAITDLAQKAWSR